MQNFELGVLNLIMNVHVGPKWKMYYTCLCEMIPCLPGKALAHPCKGFQGTWQPICCSQVPKSLEYNTLQKWNNNYAYQANKPGLTNMGSQIMPMCRISIGRINYLAPRNNLFSRECYLGRGLY